MMSELLKLRNRLKSGLVVTVSDNGSTTLEETSEEASLKKVHVTGISQNGLILKLEKAKIDFFEGSGPNRRCDYVILSDYKGKKYAVFIELKSTSVDLRKIALQFKGSQCLMDYFCSVLDRFDPGCSSLKEYEHRFVLMYKTSIRKRPTRQTHQSNTLPENPILLPDPHEISLGAIIG